MKLRVNIVVKGDDSVKCEIIIDSDCEEKVIIYARENNSLVKEIKSLAEQSSKEIIGYKDAEIVKLNSDNIECITVINNKIYALCGKEEYLLKERLYSLEEKLLETFVRINQSCLANIKKMDRFDTTISGTLKIQFKNGHTDYVSRRQLKTVKERIGI